MLPDHVSELFILFYLYQLTSQPISSIVSLSSISWCEWWILSYVSVDAVVREIQKWY